MGRKTELKIESHPYNGGLAIVVVHCMKLIFIHTIILLSIHSSYAQNKFTLNSFIGNQIVSINGRQYSVDSIGVKIPTHYPRFDTLNFQTENSDLNIPIICNFKPDSTYSISVACCGSYDIIKTFKLSNDSLKIWDYEKDFDKIQNQLMDKPFISIRTRKKPKDSIYAWHADAACMTEHRVINKQLWRLGVPPKCFYWNNITAIQFFKKDNDMPIHLETDLEEFLGLKNIVILSSISFRLFDNERFVIIFDETTQSIELEYE